MRRECDIYLSSIGKIKNESNILPKYISGNDSKRFDANNQQRYNNVQGQKRVSNVLFFLNQK